MIYPEVKIMQALVKDEQLQNTMKSMRREDVDDPMVFTSNIPEIYQVNTYAPMIRLNYIGSSYRGSDDTDMLYYPRLLVSFWAKTLADGQKLQPMIDKLIQSLNYHLYDDVHSLDSDTSDTADNQLIMFRLFYRGIEFNEV